MPAQRVAVVGGSIAGCAGALAASRSGAEVVVLERAAGRLQDRGVGLMLHNDRYTELEEAGYLDSSMPWHQLARRPWAVRDGAARTGREIGVLPLPFRSYNWGSLWEELRTRIPAGVEYRTGAQVSRVAQDAGGAVVHLGDGTQEHCDAVIGADGYRSVVRKAMYPGARAEYAGFIAWRGTLPEERLPGPPGAFPDRDAASVGFPGGHILVYRIPGPGGVGTSVNWVFYATPPAPAAARFTDPRTVQPRVMSDALRRCQLELAARHLPPFWQEVIHLTRPEDTFVQPMYDMLAPSYTLGRLVLLGDAASVARPNTGSGAVKALQDAAALEGALRAHGRWQDALAAYSTERIPIGQATVELGRRLGRAQVTATPDWQTMDQPALEQWWLEAAGPTGFGGHALRR
ncbi:FAD-dependent monooxygenase [Streptomyces sp. NPDC008121]|uniref:FAD-dependent monooxygenase n=1 Tax=Streptomyces sp. NPDC008121 TaxID=3364809 RepID=UPI0036E461D2